MPIKLHFSGAFKSTNYQKSNNKIYDLFISLVI